MQKSGNNISWSAGELIYEIGSVPDGIFIIMSGLVEIYSKDGLKLNTIGEREILGETSTILNLRRSVTAKAGKDGATASYINLKKLNSLLKKNVALAAIVEKTQLRLIDSNKQSEELSNLLTATIEKIQKGQKSAKELTSFITQVKDRLTALANLNLD